MTCCISCCPCTSPCSVCQLMRHEGLKGGNYSLAKPFGSDSLDTGVEMNKVPEV